MRQIFEDNGCKLVVAHDQQSAGHQELMAGFMALVASSSGRLRGLRSVAARRRLLEEAQGPAPSGAAKPAGPEAARA
jgi:predicted site-specific integrase-resolvase